MLGVLLPACFGLLVGYPDPLLHDEYSYLLAADTFSRGRLSNPTPVLPEFFETEHVLVVPSYQSKYPPAQALFLAAGIKIFGHAIWGVWISCGLFSASLCWMLHAWTSRRLSIVMTLLSIAVLGTSSYWAQSYWGGMVAAAGGALFFGGVRYTLRRPRVGSSVLMAAGLIVLANSRPFEGALASLPAIIALVRWLSCDWCRTGNRKWRLVVWPAAVVLAAGLLWMCAYNRAVTGDAFRIPYTVHQRQYFHQGVFLFSALRTPERRPPERIAKFYDQWEWSPATGLDGVVRWSINFCVRMALALIVPFGFVTEPVLDRNPFVGVLLWPVLILSLCAPMPILRSFLIACAAFCLEWIVWRYVPAYPYPLAPFSASALLMVGERGLHRHRWLWLTGAILMVVGSGQALVGLWYPHYFAPVVPLILATAASALRGASVRLGTDRTRTGGIASVFILFLILLTSIYAGTPRPCERTELRSRSDVGRYLEGQPGSHLVFVSYSDTYPVHQEWVYNGADMRSAKVIFAHDLGASRNSELVAAYSNRVTWKLAVGWGRVELVLAEPKP